jgi:hypothetical protein
MNGTGRTSRTFQSQTTHFDSNSIFSRALCGTKRDGNLGKNITVYATISYRKTARFRSLESFENKRLTSARIAQNCMNCRNCMQFGNLGVLPMNAVRRVVGAFADVAHHLSDSIVSAICVSRSIVPHPRQRLGACRVRAVVRRHASRANLPRRQWQQRVPVAHLAAITCERLRTKDNTLLFRDAKSLSCSMLSRSPRRNENV